MPNELVISEQAPHGVASEESFFHDGENHVPHHGARPASYADRRAEIERIRSTDIDRYFNEGLDKELLRITIAEMGKTPPTEPMSVEESRSSLMASAEGAVLVMELENMGTFGKQLPRIQSAIAGMVKEMGDHRHQQVFMARFDEAIPEPVRYRIYSAVAIGPPSFVVPVDAGGVKKFSSDDVGKTLVAEWGSSAPELIAKIWKRTQYLRDDIGTEGMGHFVRWFEDLAPATQKRVLKFIATGK